MPIDTAAALDRLKKFDFSGLFTQDLGWDFPPANTQVSVAGKPYALRAVAHKRGLVVYECAIAAGDTLPDSLLGRKIDRELTKQTREHIIIFTDAARTTQVWQWVKREPGAPLACRRHTFHVGQSGESLIQKLDKLFVSLDEEEGMSIVEASGRVRAAFDVDRVTKRFYERFREEHSAFLGFIKGLPRDEDREWYASLMLNRLMFIYFIQKKGFLDGDRDYLRNKLAEVRLKRGKDKFHSFYRDFLLRLFHDGLGSQRRDADLEALLGRVPFLNGGLFEVHQLENDHPDLAIPDKAFERLFSFFDEYQWHLDERPLRRDNEINPDVLGYIFEKYINQKQMGAYYTKEDITDYISKNTIVPYLFDAVKKKRPADFRPESPIWQLLRDAPDRYLYPAMRHGVIDEQGQVIELPADIAAGIDDVAQRGGWNRAASAPFALPTETWREHVSRRRRCLELREKLACGEIHEINDLITYNLDIRQFAEDAVAGCDDQALLRAFYNAISTVSVLDPTCGSGAFLFAALNVLEPLYNACLERMEELVEELDAASPKPSPKKLEDFRKTLAEIERHPNRAYFVLKSIILGNLYGVDIMEEAVEICKLRLFLKLASQVNPDFHHPNLGIEPLPDIDFNIRAGNTLVGFPTLDDVKQTLVGTLGFSKEVVAEIVEDAEIIDRQCQMFHRQQTQIGGHVAPEDKIENRARLARLAEKLNRHLAHEYRVDPDQPRTFASWRVSHQPFHWCADFYAQISYGGFDVIVGNPPYVEYSKIRSKYRVLNYATESCGNLYALCTDRAHAILKHNGRFGFIVQAPLVSTQRMLPARSLLNTSSEEIFYSTYDDRPSKLFDGLDHCRLVIVLSKKGPPKPTPRIFTTRYHKWYAEERAALFQLVAYQAIPADVCVDVIPKLRSHTELSIYNAVMAVPNKLGEMLSPGHTDYAIYYKITGVGHWFTFTLRPPSFWRNGEPESSTRENVVHFSTKRQRDTAYCCLCSSLHYWLYQARTNCRDFNPSDLNSFPITNKIRGGVRDFEPLAAAIMARLAATATTGSATYAVGGSVRFEKFSPKTAKDLYDEVDRLLATQYGLNGLQLDSILNYDIKYRIGQSEGEADQ